MFLSFSANNFAFFRTLVVFFVWVLLMLKNFFSVLISVCERKVSGFPILLNPVYFIHIVYAHSKFDGFAASAFVLHSLVWMAKHCRFSIFLISFSLLRLVQTCSAFLLTARWNRWNRLRFLVLFWLTAVFFAFENLSISKIIST
jgi:hypothetical protein